MSLRGRYNSYGKRSVLQYTVFLGACIAVAFFLLSASSLARYAANWEGDFGSAVASWRIKVSVAELLGGSGTFLSDSVPIGSADSSGGGAKISAGQDGYFDVVIDPTDTEVAFSYNVVADCGKLPNGMTVDGYAVATGADGIFEKTEFEGDNKSVSGTVCLPTDGAFGEQDRITVRFYWTWADVDFDEFAEYGLAITVSARQSYGCEGARRI